MDLCPDCGRPVSREEVDIGVGVQCGPPYCEKCGWSEPHDPALDMIDLSEDEGGIPF